MSSLIKVIGAGIITFSLSCQPRVDLEVEKENIRQTDIAFSAMSEQDGFRKAFVAFADEDVILVGTTGNPIIGLETLKERYANAGPSSAKLTWQPVNVEIASSADLGYTFGRYVRSRQDSLGQETKTAGHYVNIWKKQPDGRWKFVVDAGSVGKPLQEE